MVYYHPTKWGPVPGMIHRNITDHLLHALVEPGRQYLTFDDPSILAAAKRDPSGFVSGLNTPVILDEVQHIPEVFQVIKLAVDRKREPGRFLLTGSANVLLLPKLSESLAGRMEVLTLWPFSQGDKRSSGSLY